MIGSLLVLAAAQSAPVSSMLLELTPAHASIGSEDVILYQGIAYHAREIRSPQARRLEGGCPEEELLRPPDPEFYEYLLWVVGLITVAGVMAGCTMGVLSLDPLKLKLKLLEGTDDEKRCANVRSLWRPSVRSPSRPTVQPATRIPHNTRHASPPDSTQAWRCSAVHSSCTPFVGRAARAQVASSPPRRAPPVQCGGERGTAYLSRQDCRREDGTPIASCGVVCYSTGMPSCAAPSRAAPSCGLSALRHASRSCDRCRREWCLRERCYRGSRRVRAGHIDLRIVRARLW